VHPLFNFDALTRHRARAAKNFARLAPVFENLSARLLERLDDTSRRFTTALDFGGRGITGPALAARGLRVTSAEFTPEFLAGAPGETHLITNPENFALPEAAFDLVIAPLSLHWFDDLPGALIQLRRALKPEGLFLGAIPLLGTLQPLREALLEAEEELTGRVSPRISPFPELRDAAGLLQRAGFALPVADAEEITLSYRDPFKLLHDLRAAGETNALFARARAIPPQALFPLALSKLPVSEGRVHMPLNLGSLTGWAPS
jgi:SAM-dependent methyltransferase